MSPHTINQVAHSKRISKEFIFGAHVGEFEMDNIILDLGSDVNILPKNTWEIMGKPKLT